MADAGSVAWQFTRSSYFSFPLGKRDPDMIFELAVEAGAEDVTFDNDMVEIIGPVAIFKQVSESLKSVGIKPEEAGLRMIPNTEVELGKDETLQVLRMIEMLEDMDDVQAVYSNLAITEEMMSILEAV